MMNYQWYKIFNQGEFDVKGLVSQEITLELEDRGFTTFLITKGNTYGITVDDIFIPLRFNGENPYVFQNKAVYVNEDLDVFLGFEVEE
jgi:hypothetical protein